MAFKAFTCLLFVGLAITCAASARILNEELQPVPAVASKTSDSVDADIPPVAAAPIKTTPGVSVPGVTRPNTNTTAATIATVAKIDPHHFSFYMHNVLGGSNSSAKAVTRIVTNPTSKGELPFFKSNGGVVPVNNDIPLDNDNYNLPFLTGFGESTYTLEQNNGKNLVNSLGHPSVNGAQFPGGNTVQKLMFGTMSVFDDELSEGHELGSGLVGKAQGFYIVSSEDGSSHTMAFTAMFESGTYVDSINLFGVHRTALSESQIGIMGGTGKYVNAKGYATIKTIHSEKHSTDRLETLLEFTVYLA